MAPVMYTVMSHSVTQKPGKNRRPSIQPFIDYLASDQPLNDGIRKWLLDMLGNGIHGCRLELVEKRGRKSTSQDHDINGKAYEYYGSLLLMPISRKICQDYARAVGASRPTSFITQKPVRGGELKMITTYSVNGKKLVKGTRMRGYMALALTAKKFPKAADTLRKSFVHFRGH